MPFGLRPGIVPRLESHDPSGGTDYESGISMNWEALGAIERELYRGKEQNWLQLHSSPGRREWWKTHSVMLNDDSYTEVSRQLEAIPVRRLGESIPIFDSSGHHVPETG